MPKGAPPECEKLRQQPDALERAAELDERLLIKVGTAYESATHRRVAPPAFGQVK